MRELKMEECGMISGGIDTTNLRKVFVDGSTSTGSIDLSTGRDRGATSNAGGGDGGSGHVHVNYDKNGHLISADLTCPTGSSPSISAGSGNASGGAATAGKIIGLNIGLGGSGSHIGCKVN